MHTANKSLQALLSGTALKAERRCETSPASSHQPQRGGFPGDCQSQDFKQEEFGAFPPPGLQQSPEQNDASTSAVPNPLPAVVSELLWHSSQSAPRVPPLRKGFTFPQSRAEASSLQRFRRTEDGHRWAS